MMRVNVSDPAYLPELVDDLLHGGCLPAVVGAATLQVIYPDAANAEEARTELGFFLRAWRQRHPGVELTFS